MVSFEVKATFAAAAASPSRSQIVDWLAKRGWDVESVKTTPNYTTNSITYAITLSRGDGTIEMARSDVNAAFRDNGVPEAMENRWVVVQLATVIPKAVGKALQDAGAATERVVKESAEQARKSALIIGGSLALVLVLTLAVVAAVKSAV